MATDDTDRFMRAGLALIQQALSIFDADLRLRVSNRRYQEMFDLPDHLVTPGAGFEDTIRYLVYRGEYGPQPDPEAAVQERVALARAFKPHYMERQRSNGRWISVEGAPLPQGGWVAVYTDITEIKIQEQLLRARSEELAGQLFAHAERLAQANRALAAMNSALAESRCEIAEIEARTRLVTEMIPAHIAHLNQELVYTWSNRRLSSLLPGVPSNVVGLRADTVLGATFPKIEPHLQRALAGEAAVVEITHDESGRRLRVALTPDPAGGVYILSTDITAEAQTRAALAQTQRRALAAQLTSGLAHDFGNLLTVIMGLQSKLARLPELSPEGQELVRATLAAARRGGDLLQKIGAISGPRELRSEPVQVPALFDEVKTLAGPSLGATIRLDCLVEPDLPALWLDPGAVQDSLLNLIFNARDAILGPQGKGAGSIRISAQRRGDLWFDLIVEDDGPGFSAEALKRGLEPFFTTKSGEGAGLGLAMVFDHAALAGGTVQLSNRPEGGARVVLRLPFQPVVDSGERLLVLLVDDDVEIREDIRERLCALGHSVVEAASADEAMMLAEVAEVSLVLTDLRLSGGETGLDLAKRLAKRRLVFGFMTALPAEDSLRQEAERLAPVLAKPFTAAALSAFIARAVAARHARAA